jgi:hypothetical protein
VTTLYAVVALTLIGLAASVVRALADGDAGKG